MILLGVNEAILKALSPKEMVQKRKFTSLKSTSVINMCLEVYFEGAPLKVTRVPWPKLTMLHISSYIIFATTACQLKTACDKIRTRMLKSCFKVFVLLSFNDASKNQLFVEDINVRTIYPPWCFYLWLLSLILYIWGRSGAQRCQHTRGCMIMAKTIITIIFITL